MEGHSHGSAFGFGKTVWCFSNLNNFKLINAYPQLASEDYKILVH